MGRNMKQEFLPTCSFCLLTFPNEAGLQVHEIRCSRKVEATHAETERVKFDATITIHNATKNPENDAYNRHPLKRRLLAAAAFEQHSPTKILRPARTEWSEIVVTNERKTPTADMKEAGAKIDVKSDAPCSTRRYTAGRGCSRQRADDGKAACPKRDDHAAGADLLSGSCDGEFPVVSCLYAVTRKPVHIIGARGRFCAR
ncbi:unnamed protein product [Haemonchus placei]|uniref:C2H2-type domain-containing protein n=1 Tax=Haemonchus placei TaxID=6290 RepID=A0A0N4X1P3_HAEPC|nr:unnamed protein product [Haemonchus placei]